MHTIAHPSTLLHTDWISLIHDTASSSENTGKLNPLVLELIYQEGWFKMLVPARYGGLQRSLPDAVRLEEALSWADGSLGWTVTLCSGAGWFGGFLEDVIAKRIFSLQEVCLAGSGASTGTAVKTEKGFLINGVWKYASGICHSTVFTANCVLIESGRPILDSSGDPIFKSFIFTRDEVEVLPAWKSIGLKATGSHSFEVKNLEVPCERCFEINPERLIINESLYRYPFLQLAEATLAVNSSGMALRFLELAEEVLVKRINGQGVSEFQKSVLEEALIVSKERIKSTRAYFYDALDRSWKNNEKENLQEDELKKISKVSRQLAQISRSCVDDLYPYCGLVAANPETTINRVWRDMHTASQHSLLTFLV